MNSDQCWLAAHLYYAEPWENFLVEAIAPFVERVVTQKMVDQFFFIRYWERGPHIRLRCKGNPQRLEQDVMPLLISFFHHYFAQSPSRRAISPVISSQTDWAPNNSVLFVAYEPEFERYGGETGIGIAEQQFELSSQVVLALLQENDSWSYDRALGAAIQLHLGFAWALGMDLVEVKQFYAFIFSNWFFKAYLPAELPEKRQEATLHTFAENFDKQKAALSSYFQTLWQALEEKAEFEEAWFNYWLHKMAQINRDLNQAQAKNSLLFPTRFQPNSAVNVSEARQGLWLILASYVHMTNNRLGIFNHDEAFLGYLITRSLESL